MGTRAGWLVGACGVLTVHAGAQPLAPDPAAAERFDAHAVVRAAIGSERDLGVMLALSPDMWSHGVRGGQADFRIPPENMPALKASGVAFEVLIEDVQVLIDAEARRLRAARGAGAPDGGWFADFRTLEEIYAYLDTLAGLRPDLAQVIDLGPSLENRPIRGLRITSSATGQGHGCKPAFLLNGCQHAREWVSPMVVMYHADVLVRQYGTDPRVTTLVDNVEWLIVPVVNPDGYVYTWTTNRLWRKNRRPNANGTWGVDNNRNWGYMWGPGYGGSSGNGGSETYRGTAPFSEPENQRVRDLALSKPGLRGHNDVHSYGQYVLWPWGYTSQLPPDQATFSQLGSAMQQAIAGVHGLAYTPGPVYTTLYPANGVATDWFYGAQRVWSFSYELRDRGQYGFILPPEQIIPNAQEVVPATFLHAEWVMQQYPFRADVDGDCRYTVADFTAFLQLFAAGDPRADMDGDGRLTVADFTAFLQAFAAGR